MRTPIELACELFVQLEPSTATKCPCGEPILTLYYDGIHTWWICKACGTQYPADSQGQPSPAGLRIKAMELGRYHAEKDDARPRIQKGRKYR